MNQAPSLSQAFNDAGISLAQRDTVTALAAARRVAYSLPMTTEPVGAPVEYYLANYQSQVNQSLGSMNESSVMDYDFAMKAVELFWIARYKVLHDPDSDASMCAVTSLVHSMIESGEAEAPAEALESLHCMDQTYSKLAPVFQQVWGIGTQGG